MSTIRISAEPSYVLLDKTVDLSEVTHGSIAFVGSSSIDRCLYFMRTVDLLTDWNKRYVQIYGQKEINVVRVIADLLTDWNKRYVQIY
jgi:hypothetical protein